MSLGRIAFDAVARRRAEKMFREGGWGPLLTFPVPRSEDEPPLVFQVRLPVQVELIELGQLTAAAPDAPAAALRGGEAIQAAANAAGVVVVGALCPPLEPEAEDGREVLATLTVTLADLQGAPAIEPGDSAPNVKEEVTRLSDRATRIDRLSRESLGEGHEPVPVRTVQYLIQSRYGALTMTFSTTHKDMFGDFAPWLFEQIVQTGFIGDTPQPY